MVCYEDMAATRMGFMPQQIEHVRHTHVHTYTDAHTYIPNNVYITHPHP